jgi:hypothetical protein
MFLLSLLQLLVTANVVPSSLILSIYLVFLRSVLQWLVTANVVPSSPALATLMVEGDICLRNVGSHKRPTVSHPRPRHS